MLWLPRGIYIDETNEHVDNVCAFLAPGEVVLAWTDDETDPQYALSRADYDYLHSKPTRAGASSSIHKLPVPDHPVCVTEEDMAESSRRTGRGNAADRRTPRRELCEFLLYQRCSSAAAVRRREREVRTRARSRSCARCAPNAEIVPIQSRDILLGGGNIHCITQQIPKGAVK